MKSFFKNLIFSFLRVFWRGLDNAASILMYHSVGDNPAFFTVKKEEFAWQMEYLKKNNFLVIKLSELITKIKNDGKISQCVCLTFDDGYKDNYQIVFSLLKKYNFPATIFLATGFLDKQMQNSEGLLFDMLSVPEIKEMSSNGLVEFMPHTRAHRRLDEISFNEACPEINESRRDIEKITGEKADIFAYPKGKVVKEIAIYLKTSGWLGAVTVEAGLASVGSDPFMLKRNSVDSTTTRVQFVAKISRAIDKYSEIKR